MKYRKLTGGFLLTILFMLFASFIALAAPPYGLSAVPGDENRYPGVYYAEAVPGADATLGIPLVAKQNLNGPTTHSPAIIMGAAVPYEVKTGPTEFTEIAGGELYAPYKYFRYQIIEEPNLNGQGGTHLKMSGFDGSYYIIRVDVSKLIEEALADPDPSKYYLHVKQHGNKALMVYPGPDNPAPNAGAHTFADATGKKTYAFSLANNAASLKDDPSDPAAKPYVDVILLSSGTLVAGAETQSTDPNVIKPDFDLSFYVDQTGDYNTQLTDYTAVPSPAPTNPTWDEMWLNKYYSDDQIPAGTTVTKYKVMGGDLEIEIMNDAGATPQFWSLRKALRHYDDSPIKMICEVPVIEGLVISDEGRGHRNVIFDVNSFDIQIANNVKTGSEGAALTVENATLTIQDSFNTTGAELAVGNNASMLIKSGGKLIIADTCQLEVEYDAASTAPGTTPTTYDCGVVRIEEGGEIENNGIITIEGTEGKPIDPAAPAVRDKKDAEFHIAPGGKLTNNGCLLSYGRLYNMGTIENNGNYDETIVSNDPDKGTFTYHKGLQISWKDDVTQSGVVVGRMYNGQNADETTNPDAVLINNGDFVLVPGRLENFGKTENKGNFYLCAVEEAVIPTVATPEAPYTMEKRVVFDAPLMSMVWNESGSEFHNSGKIGAARVEIVNNGRTGTLTWLESEDALIYGCSIENHSAFDNSGSVILDAVNTYGEMTNSGTVGCEIVVCADDKTRGRVVDTAAQKLTEIFNAALTTEGNTNIWNYAPAARLTVTPVEQTRNGGENAIWEATVETDAFGDGIRYRIEAMHLNPEGNELEDVLEAGKPKTLTSQPLPQMNGNVGYRFFLDRTDVPVVMATVTVTSQSTTPPAEVDGLVYNGQPQVLTTTGGTNTDRALEYRLGEEGSFTGSVPSATNAGDYTVYYRLQGDTKPMGSVQVKINKKDLIITGDNVTSAVNTPLKEVSGSCQVIGLCEGDTIEVRAATNADNTTEGNYYVRPEVVAFAQENNYNVSFVDGVYTVTAVPFDVTAKDNSGAYGATGEGGAAYAGYNIQLTVPAGATAYYSYDFSTRTGKELTAENYKQDGVTALTILPAGVGTHTVYYYVVNADGTFGLGGSKNVYISKGTQEAPTGITTKAEQFKDLGNGEISGLTPYTMEYRRSDSNTYEEVKYGTLSMIVPGTYYIRKRGDENWYPSPDAVVTVDEGPFITVTFDSSGGTDVQPVTGLTSGVRINKPEDPTWPGGGAVFAGWYKDSTEFDFSTPVVGNMTLRARWTADFIPSANDLVYTGEPQQLVTAPSGDLPDGYTTILYGLSDDSSQATSSDAFKEEIPTGVEPGEYYVWYKFKGDTAETEPALITVRIRNSSALCVVRFHANGGTDTMDNQNITPKLPVVLNRNLFRKIGYDFAEWNTKPDGGGKSYQDQEEVTLVQSLELYAQWVREKDHKHVLEQVPETEPGCENEGNKTYYRCIVDYCDSWFEDATALVEITDKSSVIVKALGHDWDDGVVTKEPTETEEGEKLFTCRRDSSHTKTEVIPPTGHVHSMTKVEAVKATCTEAGNTAYYICDKCGLWFEDPDGKTKIEDKTSVIIKALGHKWDQGVVTKQATYSEEGILTYTCLNDSSHTKTETIPKKDRNSSGGSGSGGSGGAGRGRTAGASSGSWSLDSSGWHYTENGVLVRNAWRYLGYNGVNYWYFFDESGTMQTGWLELGGNRYYLYPVSDGWKGRMLTGWQQIEGKWYYFETAAGSEQGRMYRSERTPDGYYVGPDGVWDGNPANKGI